MDDVHNEDDGLVDLLDTFSVLESCISTLELEMRNLQLIIPF